ncbi:hypothetical protein GGR57DRAFT_497505 [Xylariaceae sp. FL1272]|nr:hypothetical protein GGR57DRAFT_497505 [Xylariaceae sp. FL1272]
MAPTTEVVALTLLSDADNSIIAESAKILSTLPGCVRVRTSRMGNEDKVYYFVDWESVEQHEAVVKNAELYSSYQVVLLPIIADHVDFSPYPTVLDNHGGKSKSSITVFGQAFFPDSSEYTAEQMEKVKTTFESSMESLKQRKGKSTAGFSGEFASGWSREDIYHNGEISRIFIFAFGWDSLDNYRDFRDSEVFDRNIRAITSIDGFKELDLREVQTTTLEKS